MERNTRDTRTPSGASQNAGIKAKDEPAVNIGIINLKGMAGVRSDIRIAQAIPDHSKLDKAGLEASFRRNGFSPSPVAVWRNPVDKKLYLLDGFERIAICQKLGLPLPPGRIINGLPDFAAAIQYRINKHLNRRNMSPMWIAYLWGSKYNSIKKCPHRPNGADNLNGNKEAPQNEVDTSEKVAIEAGVGHATIERYAQFAKNVDLLKEAISQEFARGLLDKKYKLSKGDIIKLANMPEAERKAIAEALISNPKWKLSEAEQAIHPPTQGTTSAKSNPNSNDDQGNGGGADGDGDDPSDDNLNGEGNPQTGGSSNSGPDESDRILQTFNSKLLGYWVTIQNMDRVGHPEHLPNLIKTLKDVTERLEKIEANSRSI